MTDRLREYYRDNPLMVSSPFGGVSSLNDALADDVFRRLKIELAGRRVLDVGCGRGYFSEFVEARGGSYTGADFVANIRSGIPFVLADAQRLPLADAAFDAVFCVDAFEHFPDGAAAAAEFRRVLKPGGCVFLSVPNYGNVAGFVKWWCEHFGRYEKDSWAPFRNWQPQALEQPLTNGHVRRLFADAGFAPGLLTGHEAEAGLGLFPWVEHRAMPEAVKFRLQRLFLAIGPSIVRACPTASLHSFWKFTAPV